MLTCATYKEVADALRSKKSFQYKPNPWAIIRQIGPADKNPIFGGDGAAPMMPPNPKLNYRLKLVTTARTQILYSHSYDWPIFIAVYANAIHRPMRVLAEHSIAFEGFRDMPADAQMTHFIVNTGKHYVDQLKTTVKRQLNFALRHYLFVEPYAYQYIETTRKLADGLAAYIRDAARLRNETQLLDAGVAMFCAQNSVHQLNDTFASQRAKTRLKFRRLRNVTVHRLGAMI